MADSIVMDQILDLRTDNCLLIHVFVIEAEPFNQSPDGQLASHPCSVNFGCDLLRYAHFPSCDLRKYFGSAWIILRQNQFQSRLAHMLFVSVTAISRDDQFGLPFSPI
jgi:hypothetical protein